MLGITKKTKKRYTKKGLVKGPGMFPNETKNKSLNMMVKCLYFPENGKNDGSL